MPFAGPEEIESPLVKRDPGDEEETPSSSGVVGGGGGGGGILSPIGMPLDTILC